MRVFIKRLAFANKDQRGFTLVELIIAIAITGIITVGLVMTIFQLFGGNAQSSGEMTVIRQVQNAGYYISRDAQMAQEVSVDNDPGTPELVTLTWYEYCFHELDPIDRDGNGFRVIYTLVDGKLEREYYFAVEDSLGEVTFDSEPDYTTFIAKYIEEISCSYDGSQLALTVTASIGGWKPQSETRIYETMPRPDTMY